MRREPASGLSVCWEVRRALERTAKGEGDESRELTEVQEQDQRDSLLADSEGLLVSEQP